MARTRNQRTVPFLLLAVAAVLVALRVVSAFVEPKADPSAGVTWVTLEQASRLAHQTGKPLLLDFTADWCAPCHELDKAVFNHPELAMKINEHFIAVRVLDRQRETGTNAPDVEALQQRYSVQGFPTVIFVDNDGTERARMEGFRGVEDFERVMATAMR